MLFPGRILPSPGWSMQPCVQLRLGVTVTAGAGGTVREHRAQARRNPWVVHILLLLVLKGVTFLMLFRAELLRSSCIKLITIG